MTGLEPRSPHAGMTGEQHGAHGGHQWMMIACCVPMLVIAHRARGQRGGEWQA
jgi:hypothetical protein